MRIYDDLGNASYRKFAKERQIREDHTLGRRWLLIAIVVILGIVFYGCYNPL